MRDIPKKVVRDIPTRKKVVRDIPTRKKVVRDIPTSKKVVCDIPTRKKVRECVIFPRARKEYAQESSA